MTECSQCTEDLIVKHESCIGSESVDSALDSEETINDHSTTVKLHEKQITHHTQNHNGHGGVEATNESGGEGGIGYPINPDIKKDYPVIPDSDDINLPVNDDGKFHVYDIQSGVEVYQCTPPTEADASELSIATTPQCNMDKYQRTPHNTSDGRELNKATNIKLQSCVGTLAGNDIATLDPNDVMQSQTNMEITGEPNTTAMSYQPTITALPTTKPNKRKTKAPKPYVCTLCKRSFVREDNLQTHLERHDQQQLFQCTDCKYKTYFASDLKKHSHVHSSLRPFSCVLCPYTCKRSSVLKIHMLTHSDEKSVKCELCDFRCKQASNLAPHWRIYHGSVNRFACLHCDVVSPDMKSFKLHKLQHIENQSDDEGIIEYQNHSYMKQENPDSDNINFPVNADQKFHVYDLQSGMEVDQSSSPNKLYTSELNVDTLADDDNGTLNHVTQSETNMETSEELSTTAEMPHQPTSDAPPVLSQQLTSVAPTTTKRSKYIRKKTAEKPYVCTLCKRSFVREDNLQTHLERHDQQQLFQCTDCQYKTYYSAELKKHSRVHSNARPFSCVLCTYTCKRSTVLKVHMLTHSDAKAIKCELCDFSCKQISGLRSHNQIYHSSVNRFSCEHCDFASSDMKSFKLHKLIHIENLDKPHKCETCGVAFKQSSNLKKHQLTVHSDIRPYKCTQCGKTWKLSHDLKEHMRIHDPVNNPKTLMCTVCGYQCRVKQSLKLHMESHATTNAYMCPECGANFKTRQTLREHKKTHSAESISCTICNFRCRQKGNMKLHMRRHTGSKPYSCPLCPYTCSNSSSLKQHLNSLLHSTVKHFTCSMCDHRTTTHGNLQTHMKIHSGVKRFGCTLCDFRSNYGQALRKHMRNQHTVDNDS